MDVARALRDARRRAGLSQAGLAAGAGTSQATISAYESAAKQPTIDTLERLLAAAGSRLTVAPETPDVRQPTAVQHARAARTLVDVLTLADALPTRHQRELQFPRLGPPATEPR